MSADDMFSEIRIFEIHYCTWSHHSQSIQISDWGCHIDVLIMKSKLNLQDYIFLISLLILVLRFEVLLFLSKQLILAGPRLTVLRALCISKQGQKGLLPFNLDISADKLISQSVSDLRNPVTLTNRGFAFWVCHPPNCRRTVQSWRHTISCDPYK